MHHTFIHSICGFSKMSFNLDLTFSSQMPPVLDDQLNCTKDEDMYISDKELLAAVLKCESELNPEKKMSALCWLLSKKSKKSKLVALQRIRATIHRGECEFIRTGQNFGTLRWIHFG